MATPANRLWQATSQTVTGNQITASETGVAGRQHFVTLISGWADVDADITLTDGTDTYELRLDASVNGFSFHLPIGQDVPFAAAPGATVSLTIGDGSQAVTNGSAQMIGYSIP